MRGKQGAETARRRHEAAMEHIDRLVDQLTEAKRRMREAEARAARLEGIENQDRAWEELSRAMLAEAHRKLTWWKTVADQDHQRRQKAFRDLGRLMTETGAPTMTTLEDFEFLNKRYPALMSALTAGAAERWAAVTRLPTSPYRRFEKKLHGDDLARFQRLIGERTTLNADKDLGIDWADLLEAKQAGFSPAEALAYGTGDEEPLRKRNGELTSTARRALEKTQNGP